MECDVDVGGPTEEGEKLAVFGDKVGGGVGGCIDLGTNSTILRGDFSSRRDGGTTTAGGGTGGASSPMCSVVDASAMVDQDEDVFDNK
jgi:hypothetical protein